MNILKTARIGAYGIAALAGAMSYGHQATLLHRADLGLYSWAVPVTVDMLAFEQPSAEDRQLRPTMCHESLPFDVS